ncbi:MAG TPA: SBBP repeat-containing protein [Chitinophagales bacterium]|nr:SBBP repeat-containing protein [Chitinophagales bacterium]
MKTIYLLTLFLVVAGLRNHVNSQNLNWAIQMGGADNDIGKSVVVDGAGNVYTTGSFDGTADFDPGPGTYNLTTAGVGDIFISKLDASGNFLWAKQIGGTTYDYGYSIAVDSVGNVYTTGYFDDTADFDPGPGTYNLTTAGSADIFVSKLDNSGNFIWAKQMGATQADFGYAITVDVNGYVYTTGEFNGTVNFDPGPGIFNLISTYPEIFISKLDASGDFVWAKQLGGTGEDKGYSIAVDESGNVYSTGYFKDTADFDPGTGIYNLIAGGLAIIYSDIYISKLDASGNFVWAKQMGGTNNDRGNCITLDALGNIYLTGTFSDTCDFDPGPSIYNLISAGFLDVFISKLDTAGNFLWAKQTGSTSSDEGYSVAVTPNGNVYTTGGFFGTADFDPGVGIYNLTSSGSSDMFVSILNGSGDFLSAFHIGGIASDYGFSMVADETGSIYITGQFQDVADFDPGPGVFNMSAFGSSIESFVMKLSDVPTWITENNPSFNAMNIYPSPGNGQVNIVNDEVIREIKITNRLGQIVYQAKPNANSLSLQLDVNGIYFILITGYQGSIVKKIIICKQ